MRSCSLLFALASFGAAAQTTTLWIDLSGPWKMILDDRPEYASTGLDDHTWRTLTLPRGGEFYFGAKYWLRKRVEFPAGTELGQLALTLGALQDVYQVYINGQLIGATGSFESFSDSLIPRPRTFNIPAAVVARRAVGDASIQVALRVRGALFFHPDWRLQDKGPYLLTDHLHAPSTEGRRQLEERWIAVSPHLGFGAIFGVIGLLSLLGWLGERERREFLWFAFVSFARAFGAGYLVHQILADSHPFNDAGLSWEFVLSNFDAVLSVEFAIAALSVSPGYWRWILWLGWCGAPLSLLLPSHVRIWTFGFPAMLWISLVGLAVVLWDWWRTRRTASREQHALHLFLFLYALNASYSWWYFVRENAIALSKAVVTFNLQSVQHFAWGSYRVQFDDLFWLLISAAILTLLTRRVARDRRERQRMASELEAARVIQQLLLPSGDIDSGAFVLQAVYQPALEVGGDFYWARVSPDRSLLVSVGDVSGKGLKAAMLVSVAIGILRNEKSTSPGTILKALNDGLVGNTGGGFVTCCSARFNPADGTATIASAGHPAPYCNGQESDTGFGLPLGISAEATYDEQTVKIGLEGALTILSDGVVEAANAKGELFGFDRTRGISSKSAQEIAETARSWGQNDDITVVTVKRKA